MFFKPKQSAAPEPPDELKARVAALRTAWADFQREAEALRKAGAGISFTRNGLGDPYTGPHDFGDRLNIWFTTKL